jgi:hypothetical protein
MTTPSAMCFLALESRVLWVKPPTNSDLRAWAPRVSDREGQGAGRPREVGNDLWRTFNVVQENVLQGALARRRID